MEGNALRTKLRHPGTIVVLLAMLVALLVLGSIIIVCNAQEAKGTASVSFPEPAYTFETVFEGATVLHEFAIQNKGTEVLDVKRVSGG